MIRNMAVYGLIDHRESVSTVIFAAMLCLLCYWWGKRQKKIAPGPLGFPLIGAVPMLAKKPHVTLSNWGLKHGPVMSVRVGREDWTVLTTIQAIKEAFVKQGAKFSSRPPNYFTDYVLSAGRNGIMFNDGSRWKSLKRYAISAFTKLGCKGRLFENIIDREACCLAKKLFDYDGQLIDLSPHLLGATANVISTVLCGRREEYGTDEYSAQYAMIKKFVVSPDITKLANAVIFMPTLRYLPLFKDIVSQGKVDAKDMERFLELKMLQHDNCPDQEDFDCLIDIFKSKKYRGDHPDLFNNQTMAYLARDLLIAGTESTTVTLLWCVLALIHDLELQAEIRREIDTSFSPTDSTLYNHKQSMPLTFSFLEEIHRYCSVAPLALPHMANEEALVCGYTIPKRSTVIVNLWGTHRDPKVFEDPNVFKPRRFIKEDGKFSKSRNVISFSIGCRSCLGEKIANAEIFTFLCKILKDFKLLPSDRDNLPSINDGVLSTTYSPKPFKVILSRRS